MAGRPHGRPVVPRLEGVDEVGLARLLRTQDGVVSRAQALALGGTPAEIRRRRRRRMWATLHPGVYVDHTGPPTIRQRQWAAVLACGPGAALHRQSALEAHGLTRDRARDRAQRSAAIRVAIDASRRVEPPPGVQVERVLGIGDWIVGSRRPPRVAVELAVLKVASDREEAGAIADLADVCRQGLTTPDRLVAALARLPRLPGRREMLLVLDDVASGAHSVLEQRYLDLVERTHELPAGDRQRREVTADGVVLRDVRYAVARTLVELDGRFGHTDTDDRWDDLGGGRRRPGHAAARVAAGAPPVPHGRAGGRGAPGEGMGRRPPALRPSGVRRRRIRALRRPGSSTNVAQRRVGAGIAASVVTRAVLSAAGRAVRCS